MSTRSRAPVALAVLLLPLPTLAQDPGDFCDTAAPVALDSTRDEEISPPGDVDFFRLEVPTTQPVLIETTGFTDTIGTLRNAACETIASSDDEGTGLNLAFLEQLAAGTYYVEVRHFSPSGTGAYALHVARAVDEAGEDCPAAREIRLGESLTGLLVPAGDRDYYRVAVPAPGRLEIGLDSDASLTVTLRSGSCSEMEKTSAGLARFVEAGTYYVEVGAGSAQLASYTLSVSFPDCNGATPLSPGSTADRTRPLFELEYFRVDLAAPGNLRVFTTGDSNTAGELLDRGCNLLRFDDNSGAGANFEILRDLAPDVYYVGVEAFSGPGFASTASYTVHAERADPPAGDVPRTCHDAVPLDPGASRSEQLQPEGDLDVYRIDVPRAATLTLTTTGSLDTFGRLDDSRCATLASGDDGGSGANFSITRAVEAGTYYVEVLGASTLTTGPYGLRVETEPPPEGDPGASCATAAGLGLSATLDSELSPAGDADYYRLDVPSPGTLTLRTRSPSAAAVASVRLRDAGCAVAQLGRFSDDNGEVVSRFVTAGTYYAEVYSSTAAVGSYGLTTAFDAGALPASLAAARAPRAIALVVDAPLPDGLVPGAPGAAEVPLADELLAALLRDGGPGLAAEVALLPMPWSEGSDAPAAVAELERQLGGVRDLARARGTLFAVVSRGWGGALAYAALALASAGDDPVVPDLAVWIGAPVGAENATPARDARLVAAAGEWLDARLEEGGCPGCRPAARRPVNYWAPSDALSGPLRFDQLPGGRNVPLQDPSAAAPAVAALVEELLDGGP